eukprot:CAMPEP_0170084512 /NCGR_PEP_ID=MMETSP0019_2-20121128/19691_1 /TAXON_ID=98059 /ORGANISM="Dinobryon sp., Strain UTEXLB2267" /LENGTH=125 /DNA_ID=CAMNT_0010300639 /DNA_START=199 /DNA_END=576 /DNA_ORIENTATION=+
MKVSAFDQLSKYDDESESIQSSTDISLIEPRLGPKVDQIIGNDTNRATHCFGLLNENQKSQLMREPTLRKLLRSKRLRDHITDIDNGSSDAERSIFLENMRKNNSEFREFTNLLLKTIEEQPNKQ